MLVVGVTVFEKSKFSLAGAIKDSWRNFLWVSKMNTFFCINLCALSLSVFLFSLYSLKILTMGSFSERNQVGFEGLRNREDSPVVLFKDQNIFDEDLYPGMKAEDFLLVIMNASQKDMLKFYRNDTICLDFTHGMNAYGFDLATLLVLDDKREGFPAAFILSNRQDSTALKLAFAAIKEHTCIAPKVLNDGR
ncbi:MULE domain-containing protein [Trichonephila clavata]|uniref:MULE domain-containing protein n=1 Tax=Trichonephila clavata TaxID=2740835 RepID=A0A8X6HDN8_TRICU|nr:MULE domain-containing protein [Trichonephila clavata]